MEPLSPLCRPALVVLTFLVIAAVMYCGVTMTERAEDNAEETWRSMYEEDNENPSFPDNE